MKSAFDGLITEQGARNHQYKYEHKYKIQIQHCWESIMKSAFDGLITEQDARNARSTIWQSSALCTHCPRQSTRIQKYDNTKTQKHK